MYPPLSPLLINMTWDNLLDTQIFFESQIFFQGQISSSSARGKLRTNKTKNMGPIEHGTLPYLNSALIHMTPLQYKKKSNTNH